MSAIVWIIWFIVLLLLIYAFFGVFAFFAYFIWVVWGVFYFPIDLIAQVVYPVGFLPYYVWTAGIALIFVMWVFWLFKKS